MLEDCNLKLTSVLTDVMGKTGRAIVEALIQGHSDPQTRAELAVGSLRTKRAERVEALRGRTTAHHRFVLRLYLGLYDAVHAAIAAIDQQDDEQLHPFRQAADLLETMPGIGRIAAEVILAEIGPDMERFPNAGHPARRSSATTRSITTGACAIVWRGNGARRGSTHKSAETWRACSARWRLASETAIRSLSAGAGSSDRTG